MKETELFEIIDQLNEAQTKEIAASVKPSQEIPLDKESITRLKAKTFAKLDLPHKEVTEQNSEPLGISDSDELDSTMSRESLAIKKRSARRLFGGRIQKGMLIAGVVAVFCSLFAYSSPEVRAQIRKAIQFLPGFAAVQDTQEQSVQYVLPNPVVIKMGGGQIEIRGLSVGDKLTEATLTGSGVPWTKSLSLRNGKGKEYLLRSGFMSGSGGEWTGSLYYQGAVEVTDDMTISIVGDTAATSIRLMKAQQVDRVEDLGVTDAHEGISITAITKPTDQGRTKVTLVPQLPGGMRIESYGYTDYSYLKQPELKNATGKLMTVERDNVFPNPNEFTFQKENGDSEYMLTVPEIAAVMRTEKPEILTLPIPEEGIVPINKTVMIQGFPVTLTSVERLPSNDSLGQKDSLKINVDMHYDASASKSLRYFIPDQTKYPEGSGMGLKVNEQTRAMEFMVVEVPQGATQYKLYVIETHYVVRGPWKFHLLPRSSASSELDRNQKP